LKRPLLAASTAVLGLALVAALLPASALAVVHDYSGSIDGQIDQIIAFDVVKKDSGKKVKHMVLEAVPYTCDGDPPGETEPMQVAGSFKVSHRKFSGKNELKPLTQIDPTAKVTGKLDHGGEATGTIRVSGELAGPGSDCHSATLDWEASKPL
jgi:hypothetical protein